jgi:hypothetical protein
MKLDERTGGNCGILPRVLRPLFNLASCYYTLFCTERPSKDETRFHWLGLEDGRVRLKTLIAVEWTAHTSREKRAKEDVKNLRVL